MMFGCPTSSCASRAKLAAPRALICGRTSVGNGRLGKRRSRLRLTRNDQRNSSLAHGTCSRFGVRVLARSRQHSPKPTRGRALFVGTFHIPCRLGSYRLHLDAVPLTRHGPRAPFRTRDGEAVPPWSLKRTPEDASETALKYPGVAFPWREWRGLHGLRPSTPLPAGRIPGKS